MRTNAARRFLGTLSVSTVVQPCNGAWDDLLTQRRNCFAGPNRGNHLSASTARNRAAVNVPFNLASRSRQVRLLTSPERANPHVSLTSPLKTLNTKAMSNTATHDVNMSCAGRYDRYGK